MRYTKQRGIAYTLILLGGTALGLTALGGSHALAGSPSGSDPVLDATAAVQKNFVPVGDFTNLVKKVTPAGSNGR
jgi:hypothetical protein